MRPPVSAPSPQVRLKGAAHKRFAILASEFHPAIARALVRGATDTLRRHGIAGRRIRLLWVPGAFELPVVAARLARRRPRPDAILALGCLIRGETSQYDVIAHAVANGLSQVSVTSGVPVTFGLIVAQTPAQARARAGGRLGNRGEEAALAALAVLRLLHRAE
ncbi:MAG: 6,7-dimethyl-8-ribityllumazine synthase [Candidatus Omnitrophica bacterium]|nr:6,7-dimethyl-8-ribityllumazine synthase [Candidatus Omnitrophota bacterium]